MRRDCTPYLVAKSSQNTALTRIHFDDKKVAESFLQETIHASPGILPINRLDSDYHPPVCIGREIANIDNLLVSPTGRISIVETKLWRNPQATREVIAQAIEYANSLWEMEYDEFQELARTALSPAPLKDMSLYEYIAHAHPSEVLGEADFHDEIQKCLNNAEFLLLIVGDGIRENLEGMADMLYQPQMHFKFGLIEVQVYESPAIPCRLVIPNIVAHATELRRTVVRVEGGTKATVSVNIDEPTVSKGRRVLSEDEFFSELRDSDAAPLFRQLLEFGSDLGAIPLWRASSVGLRLPDPRGLRKLGFTLFLLNLDGTVSDAFLGYQLDDSSGDITVADNRAKALSKAYGVPYVAKYHALERGIPWRQLAAQLDTFKTLMRETVNQIAQMPVIKK
jgi:hypothetical protein